MIKKAFIRTEILKYLSGIPEPVTIDTVFEHLPEIYRMLKENPEAGMPADITYERFAQEAQQGLMRATIEQQMGIRF